MTKNEYRAYIASADWQQRRKQFLTHPATCYQCDMPRWVAQLAYDQDLHVHHTSYANLGHETHEDVEILCRRCHELETFGRSSLRQVKGHQCDRCMSIIFDPYAELCEPCHSLINRELDCPILAAETKSRRGNALYGDQALTVWQWLIWNMTWITDTDTVIDELIKRDAAVAAWKVEQEKQRVYYLDHPEEMPF